MSIAKIIKELREKHDLTQSELGAIAGVSGKAVWTWESGTAEPRIGAVEKMASYFGMTKSELLGWDTDEPPASNIFLPNAHAIPILGQIACGNSTCLDDSSYNGEFVLDSSIRADYCLIATGDSMVGAGIEDGDRVFMKKTFEYHDGKIYGVVIKGENEATLKRIYHEGNRFILQPCNPDYKPVCLYDSEVYIVGECVGVYKSI